MRLSNIVRLYRVRLRSRIVQELFAVLGIAVGVALLFSSQVASTSLDGAVRQLTTGIVGQMRFQITARDAYGFDARLLSEVQRIPGVLTAVPVLQESANVVGPQRSQSVDLVGTEPRLAYLGGALVRKLGTSQLSKTRAFMLPAPIAQRVGASSLQPVQLQIGARTISSLLVPELLAPGSGVLGESPIAIAPLHYAQLLTGMTGRLTSIYVRSQPRRDREVSAQLRRLAAGRLNVGPADFTDELFHKAAEPTNQSTSLFSAISALVGFLFAFNALLLTVPQRRNLIEDLRLDGYTRKMIVEVLLFDAVVLGIVACVVGLALGELMSVELFRSDPGYLSFAFPIGSERVVTWQSYAIAVGGGLVAAIFGVLAPLRGNLFARITLGDAGDGHSDRWVRRAVPWGLTCLLATTAILLLAPEAAIIGVACLTAALLLLLPMLLDMVVLAFDRLQRTAAGAASYLATIELRSRSNRARSTAIAATGAIAVFGSVAIQGAHQDLQNGLDRLAHELNAATELWVSPAGAANALTTTPFHGVDGATLARLPGVQAVNTYRGSFLDIGTRRVWVLASARTDPLPVSPSQVVQGNPQLAIARIRRGGWVALSQAIASELKLRLGQAFTLPSPRPTRLRLAAITTNFGWPPGAVVLNADDYAHAWSSEEPSAYQVVPRPGVPAADLVGEIKHALGPDSALTVVTSTGRERSFRATSRQGLARLTQISTLVLIAGILAMAAAMGAMIWQRRPQLADMKVDGFDRRVLWRALLIESGLLLGAGCSIGALFGVYGQLLLSHALASVTGFPVIFSIGALVALSSFLLVTAVAVAIVAVPGYIAARVRPGISLQD
ncbi:MAG TPA: FtsX-like permease family protein [Solirubrobacteraceae bacterium]|jgi:putative ABC transport system permease protein|nr:FtsX-like permease family protein [Solirubrobacteraceae bacterium]